jgi:hypothetical protein
LLLRPVLPSGAAPLGASNRPPGVAPLANAGPFLVADLVVGVAPNRPRLFPARILLATEIRGDPTRAGDSWPWPDRSRSATANETSATNLYVAHCQVWSMKVDVRVFKLPQS